MFSSVSLVVLLAASAFGCLFMIAAAILVPPGGRREQTRGNSEPPVTILVPLHGDEPGLFDNLAAFCNQAYAGPIQIVLGAADPGDAAIRVVKRLQLAFPDRAIDLVVNTRVAGTNPKVSNLVGMSSAIRHEIVVLVDSDIRVAPDHVRRVVSALAPCGGGAVTCPYFGISTGSLWSRLAQLMIDSHFLPGILVGVRFGFAQPCMGSTIALRRDSLAAIGGFEAVADCLADDYALGELLRQRGETVTVLPFAVGHICGEDSWRALWRHEVRWALTIRTIDPVGYAMWSITHALPLALVALCLGGGLHALALAAAAIACRALLVRAVERGYGLPAHPYWLIPVRDVLSFAVFIAGLAGQRVSWRGHRFRVEAEGDLVAELPEGRLIPKEGPSLP
jgi:ceramide glucosyltransferase